MKYPRVGAEFTDLVRGFLPSLVPMDWTNMGSELQSCPGRSMPLLPYLAGSFLSFSDGLAAAAAEFLVFFFDRRDDFRFGGCCLDSPCSDDDEEGEPSPSFFAAVGNILLLREDLERLEFTDGDDTWQSFYGG